MNRTPQGTVAILVAESAGPLPFAEAAFCRRLCRIGERQGLTVYVFCLGWIASGNAAGIPGYTYEHETWVRKWFPRPDIIYDRALTHDRKQQLRKHRLLARLTAEHPFVYLARGLAGKWAVYQALLQCPEAAAHLPETALYQGQAQLDEWLQAHDGEAFLKPRNGTHGKRTLHVKWDPPRGEVKIMGRSGRNTIFRRRFPTKQAGLEWVDRFTGRRPFLIQPYLQLNNSDGEPFDVRVLMQKNAKGEWSLTGMAVRVGRKDSLTSNLHGGGTAHPARPFLIRALGELGGKAAEAAIRKLSLLIPAYLETRFGRLAELGLDFGVDRQGSVWVLEVNSKPGRSSFLRIGDPETARRSLENPIGYARYLLLSKP
ncbi:YheC/YheD family endospore coat-associated protein [Paenibacillus phocaensis]|uniref:YheC/YheD family endospore coat-associated protein n=1 Tax=Paenibacillus phocaensis TaxID=1776378 RepID=UPI000399F4C0|nr:YheC/YheD family protein [Paenibacillus phocaensis]